MSRALRSLALLSLSLALGSTATWAGSLDHLTDLTGKVTPIVTLTGRDNFTSEYRYDIAVRNHSADTLVGDSLIIVLDKITNLAGDERQTFSNEPILSRFDILDEDGRTDDGKPFFRIPPGQGPDLPPQTESRPAGVRIRNKDYMVVFTPSFRVYGLKRQPQPTKPAEAVPAPHPSPHAPPIAPRTQVDKLIQLLIKKGVLTEEDWRKANQP